MLDPQHLRIFLTSADELHFSRAAEQLGLTQPQVSRQIAALERRLGVRLFNRDSRNVRLTPAGQELKERGRALFALSDQVAADVKSVADGSTGALRIGFVGSAGFRILPQLLRRFRSGDPGVRLRLRELPTAEQLQALHRHEIDLGLIRPPLGDPSLESRVIWRERLVAVLPDGHRLASAPTIELAKLASDDFVMFPREQGPGFHDRIVALCVAAGFSPRIVQRAVQMPTIVGLVAAGLGVALVPETVRDFRLRGVSYHQLDVVEPIAELAISWNPDALSPTASRFIDIIGDHSPSENS